MFVSPPDKCQLTTTDGLVTLTDPSSVLFLWYAPAFKKPPVFCFGGVEPTLH